MDLSRAGLQAAGFTGFTPLATVDTLIPRAPGVYVILQPEHLHPVFLNRSIAGHFKCKDPTVDVSTLTAKWVNGAELIYVGKADARKRGGGLRERVREYQRYGAGEPIGHTGGAYIWQLADSANLLVAWRATSPSEDPSASEAAIISAFHREHGALPFANRKRGHHPSEHHRQPTAGAS
jgi:hypothetical protein